MFYMRGVELIGPGRAGVFVNLVPVFGAIMAVVLLGEPFEAYHVVALMLVVGGIAIAQKGARRKSSSGPLDGHAKQRTGERHGTLDRTEARGRRADRRLAGRSGGRARAAGSSSSRRFSASTPISAR